MTTRIIFKDLNIAIIHLYKNQNRRERIKSLKSGSVIPTTWVNAYDGKNLSEDYLTSEFLKYTHNKFLIPFGHPVTDKWKSKMACFLSHRKALRCFSKPTLILEDDYQLSKVFDNPPVSLREIELEEVPNDWDILLLGGFLAPPKGKANKLEDVILGWNKVTPNQKFYCCHAYIVREPEKIVNLMYGTTPRTYDSYMNMNIYNKLNTYYLSPSLIYQSDQFKSDIDNANKYRDMTYDHA